MVYRSQFCANQTRNMELQPSSSIVWCPTLDSKILDVNIRKTNEDEHQTQFKRVPPWFPRFSGFQWPSIFFGNEISVYYFSKI